MGVLIVLYLQDSCQGVIQIQLTFMDSHSIDLFGLWRQVLSVQWRPKHSSSTRFNIRMTRVRLRLSYRVCHDVGEKDLDGMKKTRQFLTTNNCGLAPDLSLEEQIITSTMDAMIIVLLDSRYFIGSSKFNADLLRNRHTCNFVHYC